MSRPELKTKKKMCWAPFCKKLANYHIPKSAIQLQLCSEHAKLYKNDFGKLRKI